MNLIQTIPFLDIMLNNSDNDQKLNVYYKSTNKNDFHKFLFIP